MVSTWKTISFPYIKMIHQFLYGRFVGTAWHFPSLLCYFLIYSQWTLHCNNKRSRRSLKRFWRVAQTFWKSSQHSAGTRRVSGLKCGGQDENMTFKSYGWKVKSLQWFLEVNDWMTYKEESMKGSSTSKKYRTHLWIISACRFQHIHELHFNVTFYSFFFCLKIKQKAVWRILLHFSQTISEFWKQF